MFYNYTLIMNIMQQFFYFLFSSCIFPHSVVYLYPSSFLYHPTENTENAQT